MTLKDDKIQKYLVINCSYIATIYYVGAYLQNNIRINIRKGLHGSICLGHSNLKFEDNMY